MPTQFLLPHEPSWESDMKTVLVGTRIRKASDSPCRFLETTGDNTAIDDGTFRSLVVSTRPPLGTFESLAIHCQSP